jgi:hypothetical protein
LRTRRALYAIVKQGAEEEEKVKRQKSKVIRYASLALGIFNAAAPANKKRAQRHLTTFDL